MKQTRSSRQPPVHMAAPEADILADLAIGIANRFPRVSGLLLDEVTRATLHPADRLPRDVVRMNSVVDFLDEGSGTERKVQLVYPKDADILADKVSILTLVGAGLIGLRAGQSILWPDRDGHRRALTVTGVTQAVG